MRITPLLTLLAATTLTTAAHAQTLIVLNKAQASVSLLNPFTGETDAVIPVGAGPHEAAVSFSGNIIVVCNYGDRSPGNTLSIIDLFDRSVSTINLGKHRRPHGIVYSADDQRVFVTTEDSKHLLRVNITTGEIDQEIDTHAQGSHMVAVTPDNKLAFVANLGSNSVSVLRLADALLLKELKTGDGAEGIAAHPTKPEVWITNRAANTISIVDTQSLEIIDTLRCPSFPIRVEITPDGNTAIVSCARSGDIAFFDIASRELLGRTSMEARAKNDTDQRLFGDQFGDSPVPVGIQITPDGNTAYIANTNADVITVVDIATRTITGRLTAGKEPDGMAWSPLPRR